MIILKDQNIPETPININLNAIKVTNHLKISLKVVTVTLFVTFLPSQVPIKPDIVAPMIWGAYAS